MNVGSILVAGIGLAAVACLLVGSFALIRADLAGDSEDEPPLAPRLAAQHRRPGACSGRPHTRK